VPLDQPRRPAGVPGRQRVPHRVVGQIMLVAPAGRGPVQRLHPAGLLGLQPGAQQVGEQVMVAPPAAHLIQRHQEQARYLGEVAAGAPSQAAGIIAARRDGLRANMSVTLRAMKAAAESAYATGAGLDNPGRIPR
jgi:hypothetical protein